MGRSTLVIVVVAALAAGFLVGQVATSPAGGSGDVDVAETQRLRAEVERLRMALGERGPRLEAGATLGGGGERSGTGAPARPDPGAAQEAVTHFDVQAFDDPDKAFRALLAYAATMLAKGEEGHLALLATLDATFFNRPGSKYAQELVGSEEEAVRFLYPVIRFAMNHDMQLADMTETIFKTAAEDPQRFEHIDDDSLEIFSEGIAYMLPGMVGPERMEVFAKHAEKILATDPNAQPHSVQRMRRDVQRALESWRPRRSEAEIMERLRSGRASPEEISSLVRRLPKERLAELDLDALIGPLLESDPGRVLGVISRLEPSPAVLEQLDQRMIRAVLAQQGKGPASSYLQYYLMSTGRTAWEGARPFVEAGLRQTANEGQASAFGEAAVFLMQRTPDAEWVRWALRTHRFGESTQKRLRALLP